MNACDRIRLYQKCAAAMKIKHLKSLVSYDARQSALNQLWKLFSGPLLLILVPLYLTTEVQGYWYTFISLAALAVFADMGFSSILLLFASHEFAHLKFNDDKTLTGKKEHLIRLATLGKFATKWSCIMSLLAFPIVLLIGYFFLDNRESDIDWQLPWLLYGIASILVFLNSMVLSFIEGCDSVGDVQKIRFYVSLTSAIVTALLLITGEGLYSLALALLCGGLIGSTLIFARYKKMILQLYKISNDNKHPWAPEIFPLIWRFSISWISGYFILSVFTPLAFHFYGPVNAGQVGFSMAICVAMFSISNIWLSIITPKLNMYAAQNKIKELNKAFRKGVLLATTTYILGAATLIVALSVINGHPLLENRITTKLSLLTLSSGWLIQLIINALAIYMRSYKKEKLVIVSIFNGTYVTITTLIIAKYFPFDYIFVGFTSAYLLVLPWVYTIFKKFQRSLP